MKASKKSDELTGQADPNDLIKTPKQSRLMGFFKAITIEPAMFLISFSTSMDDVSLQQMTLYKSCMIDFPEENFNETVCTHLETDYDDANQIVQDEVSLNLLLHHKLIKFHNSMS